MGELIATSRPGVAYHLDRVARKLATGQYQTEPATCFCGATDGTVLCERDRYGLPHRMVFCAKCGVIYASPRMTEASLHAFYDTDYRLIYDAGMTAEMLDEARHVQIENGLGVHELVTIQGLTPRTVMELGCNEGGMLHAFLHADTRCLGVDWDATQIAEGQRCGRPVQHGGIEVLESAGFKADLILASHVLEHVLDLESMLHRLKALLTPSGMLYIALPSVMQEDRRHLWQNAHCWQFSARTLAYVMECCGFRDVYLTEGILSLWKPTEEIRDKTDVDQHEVYRMAQILSGKRAVMPMIRTVNKFDRTVRLDQMRTALAHGRPDIGPLIGLYHDSPAVIVCGGPSIDAEVETIRHLTDTGQLLFTIERMLPWCLQHGLVPNYVVTMDAHEDVIEAFQVTPDTAIYLVALQCHPTVLTALADRRVFTFSTEQKDINQSELFEQAQVQQWTKVNSGPSVSLCAMNLAMMMGVRAMHLFGFDCHFHGVQYAHGIAGVGDTPEWLDIEIDGYPDRIFTTTLPYLSFAQQFIQSVELFHRLGYLDRVTVHGDSLVTYLAKPHQALA